MYLHPAHWGTGLSIQPRNTLDMCRAWGTQERHNLVYGSGQGPRDSQLLISCRLEDGCLCGSGTLVVLIFDRKASFGIHIVLVDAAMKYRDMERRSAAIVVNYNHKCQISRARSAYLECAIAAIGSNFPKYLVEIRERPWFNTSVL